MFFGSRKIKQKEIQKTASAFVQPGVSCVTMDIRAARFSLNCESRFFSLIIEITILSHNSNFFNEKLYRT